MQNSKREEKLQTYEKGDELIMDLTPVRINKKKSILKVKHITGQCTYIE